MPRTTKTERLLDELASDARTALDDPLSLPENIGPRNADDKEAMTGFAIDRLDDIINALNPSEETTATYAETLSVLGRHLAERQSKIEQDELTYEEHSPETKQAYETAHEALQRSLDALDEAINALAPEWDEEPS